MKQFEKDGGEKSSYDNLFSNQLEKKNQHSTVDVCCYISEAGDWKLTDKLSITVAKSLSTFQKHPVSVISSWTIKITRKVLEKF